MIDRALRLVEDLPSTKTLQQAINHGHISIQAQAMRYRPGVNVLFSFPNSRCLRIMNARL